LQETIHSKLLGSDVPRKLIYFWLIGLIARLIAINFAGLAPDFVGYRLPIAQCINSNFWLYCECTYNHTPFYPYLSAGLFWLAGNSEFLQVFFINLPLALGDAAVPVVLFMLFSRVKDANFAFKLSAIYALNPISLIEVGISHWDGFTLMFLMLGLLAMEKKENFKVGLWTGLGFLLKQFPLGLLPVFLLKTRSIKSTFIVGTVTALVILGAFVPFILHCPETFVQNLLSHPLWKGAASEAVGIGTLKNVFDHLNVPYPKVVWGGLFLFLLAFPSLKASNKNYIYYAGILMVTLAFFTFVTHRQLLVWCFPFIILITLERKAYIPFILLFASYAIRIAKPEWYFGLLHLGVGVWYYVALYQKMIIENKTSARVVDQQ
jgi:hypothetical protein